MISRKAALGAIVDHMSDATALISPLGRISRDLYEITFHRRQQCFYNMGAMGSVLSFGIGLALAKPSLNICAIEGDGSVMMSMGTLVTLRRYGSQNLKLIIMDNGKYESTGGQPSQPEGFKIEDACAAIGFRILVADKEKIIDNFFSPPSAWNILVVKTGIESPAMRIPDDPQKIAAMFFNWANNLDEKQ